ncbi:MAG: sigma-54 dependent transcriptional regulator [Acidobacteria bacterium]|nr:sigma-54 dependent transcriptional regulator [Acidobacteriota bacterium]
MRAGRSRQTAPRVVVIGGGAGDRAVIRECFPDHDVQEAESLEGAEALAPPPPAEFVFIQLSVTSASADPNGCEESVEKTRALFPTAQIVVMAKPEAIRLAIAAVRSGASNYLTVPFALDEVRFLRESLHDEARFRGELDHLRGQFWKAEALDLVRTSCSAMRSVFIKVRQVAPTRTTVLLTGETGTGKTVLAQLIHLHSRRAAGPFISVHCGAIPEGLLESELFGHERGAFTGAVRRKLGKFEIAHSGTILLDEIGTMTPAMQTKLLQVLQDGVVQRVGSEQPIRVDVRVIAATNLDLRRASEEGRFREDLFYRLNVFPIVLLPLRERMEDLEVIVENILVKLEQEYRKHIFRMSPEVMEAVRRYSWPGNLRELESVLERAYILESSSTLARESFPAELFSAPGGAGPLSGGGPPQTLASVRQQAIERAERTYLAQLLRQCGGRVGEAAAAAGVSSRQLNTLMRRYDLHKKDFKRQQS